VLRTIIDNEIAAGLARLRVSREELLAEAELYPWVAEWPEVYEPFSLSVAFRARAIELLEFLIIDGESTAAIANLDIGIAELRDVLPGAAAKPPSAAVARKLKESKVQDVFRDPR
jgi:hypothetical protein